MKLITLNVVDSTNDYAQLLVNQSKEEEGMVILAHEQSSGKGQRGKSWESYRGMGLYASIILKPNNISTSQQFLLNKAISVAIASYIEIITGFKTWIKWPNDLIINDAKVGGILIENSLRGNQISSVIVGVGINLNNSDFANSFNTDATSFKLLTGNSYDPVKEIESLFKQIWNYYHQFLAEEQERIDGRYHQHLYKLGVLTRFIENNEVFNAKLLSVNNEGAAILDRDGKVVVANHPITRFYMPGI